MKRILIIGSGIILVLIIALVTIPFLIPTSVYQAQIEKSATKALGRDVKLLGTAKLSVFPTISARIEGAQVANPDGYDDDYMIEAGELKANVKLWPLFSRRVEVGEISLSDVTVRLQRLQNGEANWEFGDEETPEDTPTETEDKGGAFGTTIARARLNNAAIYYKDAVAGQDIALTDFTGEARLTALDKPFTSNGEGRINGQTFEYDVTLTTIDALTTAQPATVNADLVTAYGRVQYDGSVTMGETITLDGKYDVNSQTIGAVLASLGGDLPIKGSAVQSLSANGTVKGDATAPAVTFANLDLKATGLDLNYKGGLTIGETPIVDGTVTVKADQAQRLFKDGQPLIPPLTALGKVDVTTKVSGAVDALTLSDIVMTQRSDLLKTDYKGTVSLAGKQTVTGTFDTSSQNLRGLLAALDIAMEPGDTLKTFALSGNATGSLTDIAVTNANLAVDNIKATGTFGADLGGAKPRVTADLSMDTLDLTALMGGDDATPSETASLSEDWSDTPLALDSLNMANATVTIAANTIILDQITLTDALLKTRLDNGKLSAIFRRDEGKPGFRVFDGNWSGDVTIDASRTVPTMRFEALADSIAAEKMLGELTGFDRLRGIGDVSLDLTSQGQSLKALVNGLDGRIETSLGDGALRGINLARLVRSTQNLGDMLKSGDLSLASFKDVVSDDAETDFTSFLGNMTLNNGVATLSAVELKNPVVNALAAGTIDLGARTIDIRFTPRIDKSAQGGGSTIGLDGIPVPIRIYGSWTAPKFGFDTAAVKAELTARARGAVADEVRDRVGGQLGGILGQVIDRKDGAPAPTTPTGETGEPETDAAPAPEKSIEDELKDRAVEGALGAIFGGKKKDD